LKIPETKVLSLILCCLLMALVNIGIVRADELWVPPDLPSDFRPGEENWVEVTRFTMDSVPSTWWGDPSGNTDFFNCDYVEWRIRWEYTPHPAVPQYAALYVEVYEKKEDVIWRGELIQEGRSELIDVIREYGMSETSGVSYIHNQTGRFYMFISGSNMENFTVIVEQDIDSIPEFPSWTILPLVIAVMLVIGIYRKRLARQYYKCSHHLSYYVL
jgi:hypothetical protein